MKPMQVRHGALLAVKHLLVQAAASAEHLLPIALPTLLAALEEADDDVRAASAQACAAVSDALVLQGPDTARQLADALWTMLPSLDDLSAATGSALQLLCVLYSSSKEMDSKQFVAQHADVTRCLLRSTQDAITLQVRPCVQITFTDAAIPRLQARQLQIQHSGPVCSAVMCGPSCCLSSWHPPRAVHSCCEVWICIAYKQLVSSNNSLSDSRG